MTALHIAVRELLHRKTHSVLFLLSVGFGAAVLMALNGLESQISKTLIKQGRVLATADIVIEGSPPVLEQARALAVSRWPDAHYASRSSTLSMVKVSDADDPIQTVLYAATRSYPLYGTITGKSGRTLDQVVGRGKVMADQKALDQLGANVGSHLKIGELTLVIEDVIASRSDRAVSFFEFMPAIYISPDDLYGSGLIVPGGRTRQRLYIKLGPGTDIGAALSAAESFGKETGASISSWTSDQSGVYRFLDNTIQYLSFLGLLSLALGGIAAAATLSSNLAAAQVSNAIILSLGATRFFVLKVWLLWSAILAALGAVAGFILSRFLAAFLLIVFGDLLPSGLSSLPTITSAARSALLCTAGALAFTIPALATLADASPNEIFSQARRNHTKRKQFVIGVSMIVILYFLIWMQIANPRQAGWFLLGLGLVLAITWTLVKSISSLFRIVAAGSNNTIIRLAARSLDRPGNLNAPVIVAIALALVVLLTMTLLERNLTSGFVESFPPNTPNLFFINVQEDQREPIEEILETGDVRFFPLIRGRVVKVNGVPARDLNDRKAGLEGSGDRLTREFGFTYGDELLPTDKIVEGNGLWRTDVQGGEVSVFDEFRDQFGIRLGDKLEVNILGRSHFATVTSFRSIDRSIRQPFFYFQFKPGLIEDAPHTFMAGVRVDKEKITDYERAINQTFPNVTSIDLSEIAEIAAKIIGRLTGIVNALGLFSVLSGTILLIASLWATLANRVREAVLFRTLGSKRRQLMLVYTVEYLLISLITVISAVIVGAGATWSVVHFIFEIPFSVHWKEILAFSIGCVIIVTIIALVSLRSAFRTAPMEVLRYE